MNFKTHTFGCKVNTYDTGRIQESMKSKFSLFKPLSEQALVNSGQEVGSIHIINSCAVTQQATQEGLRLARRLKREDPKGLVVFTGCAAQVDAEMVDGADGLDLVVANSHKGQLPELISDYLGAVSKQKKVFRSNIFLKKDFDEGGGVESRHTRSFLKIQDGCNSFCSYCVIPFARGRSRSLSILEIVARISELTRMGVREVVLTGIHLGDYTDHDSEKGLVGLCEAILRETDLPRLRLSSLEPGEITSGIMKLFQNPRLCPHFHVSLQSPSDKVLKSMRRHYGQSDVIRCLKEINKNLPNAFVGMDIIAGHPGESLADFEEGVKLLENLPWTRMHVFPYSDRPGTKASQRDDKVMNDEVKRRAKILRDLSYRRYRQALYAQIGRIKRCLVLQNQRALSVDYWPINLFGQSCQEGKEALVDIIAVDCQASGRLLGRVISAEKYTERRDSGEYISSRSPSVEGSSGSYQLSIS